MCACGLASKCHLQSSSNVKLKAMCWLAAGGAVQALCCIVTGPCQNADNANVTRMQVWIQPLSAVAFLPARAL